MSESEAEAVRRGIEFLTELSRKDYLTNPSFDSIDLENRLDEIAADVEALISNLPVEVIDNDDEEELEGECPEDFDDVEELEDEVVACEEMVAQAQGLLAKVRAHYLPAGIAATAVQAQAPSPSPSPSIAGEKPIAHRRKKKRRSCAAEIGDLLFYFLLIVIVGWVMATLLQ